MTRDIKNTPGPVPATINNFSRAKNLTQMFTLSFGVYVSGVVALVTLDGTQIFSSILS